MRATYAIVASAWLATVGRGLGDDRATVTPNLGKQPTALVGHADDRSTLRSGRDRSHQRSGRFASLPYGM